MKQFNLPLIILISILISHSPLKAENIFTWGLNANGQLGDGTTTERHSPGQLGIDTNWSQVACGRYHTIAVKADGSLWGWGSNGNGELGIGTTTDSYSPIQIGNDSNWTQVSCGISFTIAMKTDGSLWGWGRNDFGQLGDGTTIEKHTPVQNRFKY